VLARLLQTMRQSPDLDRALQAVTGQGLASWWKGWLASIQD